MQSVMVVEDDSTMRALVKTLLDMEGYQARTFEGQSAEELRRDLASAPPDLLIMDVHLHTLDGLDILHTLRQDGAYPGLQVIMTSGFDAKDRCLQAGANAFLMKPFMPDDLIRTITSLLATY